MRETGRGIVQGNAALVEKIFSLMFETLWVPLYDPRHGDPRLRALERVACGMAVFLNAAAFAAADEERLRRLDEEAGELAECIERIAASKLFPAEVCRRAREQAARIRDGVKELSSAAIHCR